MPLIPVSSYRPPPFLGNGHLQTILPSLYRRPAPLLFQRERITTPDDDFLDLDWHQRGRDRLAILSHGLEGSTASSYIQGMAGALVRRGWDVLAWNCRSCSGEINRQLRLYHSGATEDLEAVIQHALAPDRYACVALLGFSLGGNMTLKYLGERGAATPAVIRAAVAFSVPCDLADSAVRLAGRVQRIYMASFLRSLRRKIRRKMVLWPGRIDDHGYERLRTFRDFDDRYTAPYHGFTGAEDYWRRSSAQQFLPGIRRPTLLINARNDPFLGPACFPEAEARANPCFFLETPASGGHVGFVRLHRDGEYWSEQRAGEFLEEAVRARSSASPCPVGMER